MTLDTFARHFDILRDCTLCPRNCHADRFSSKLGYCNSDASFNISSICIHMGEEPAISGSKGICNIFFTHCNLQCIFCQNWQISDNNIISKGSQMELNAVIEQVTGILDQGINKVGFVSPSHFIPHVRLIIEAIRKKGYDPVWVYNTNGYDKVEILQSLDGLIDVYLPDFKYMDKELSKRYSDAADYPEIAGKALKEMYRQKGATLHLDDDGTAISGIIIRHLVLPGAVENSLTVLRYIAEEVSPKLHVSLMSQYYPTQRVSSVPQLNRSLTHAEYDRVVKEMEKLGMFNGWIQELESNTNYRPDFNQDHPFEK